MRSLPAFMLITIPLALGLGGEVSRITIVTLASLLIIVDECAESLITLPQDRVELIRAYRGGFWFILSKVLIFEALGRAVVPVARTTIGISFIVAIVCETMLIPKYGVGARLLTSLTALEMASVFAFLLLTGFVGLLLNTGIHLLARRIIFWT
jgi:nitrate/nitrite transport system permease protein